MITSRLKSLCLYFLLIFSPFLVQGQQSAHTAGGDGSSSTGSVAVSIGQVAYSSHSVGVGTKTQGVQQRLLGSVAEWPVQWALCPQTRWVLEVVWYQPMA